MFKPKNLFLFKKCIFIFNKMVKLDKNSYLKYIYIYYTLTLNYFLSLSSFYDSFAISLLLSLIPVFYDIDFFLKINSSLLYFVFITIKNYHFDFYSSNICLFFNLFNYIISCFDIPYYISIIIAITFLIKLYVIFQRLEYIKKINKKVINSYNILLYSDNLGVIIFLYENDWYPLDIDIELNTSSYISFN